MRTRRLSNLESALVKKHSGEIGLPMIGRQGSQIFTHDQIQQAVKIEVQERQEKQKAIIAEDSAYFTSAEFRQEVIDELITDGSTEEQARNRTRDQVRLFNEAKLLGLM